MRNKIHLTGLQCVFRLLCNMKSNNDRNEITGIKKLRLSNLKIRSSLIVRMLRDKIDLHLALSDESMKLCRIVVGTILFGLRSVGTTTGPRGPKYCGLPTPNLKKSELISGPSTMSTGCEVFTLNKLQQITSSKIDVYVNHQLTWLPTNQGQNLLIGKKNALLRAVVIGNRLFVLPNTKDIPKQCRRGINIPPFTGCLPYRGRNASKILFQLQMCGTIRTMKFWP